MSRIPERTLRHFPEGLGDPADAEVRGEVTARLLEDGDRADLAWWVETAGSPWLLDWISRHAERRLSRRSRAFWRCVAGLEPRGGAALAEAVWPLA